MAWHEAGRASRYAEPAMWPSDFCSGRARPVQTSHVQPWGFRRIQTATNYSFHLVSIHHSGPPPDSIFPMIACLVLPKVAS